MGGGGNPNEYIKGKISELRLCGVDFKRQEKKKHPTGKAASLTIQCERYMFECKRDKGEKPCLSVP